jgi:hypothetical protein
LHHHQLLLLLFLLLGSAVGLKWLMALLHGALLFSNQSLRQCPHHGVPCPCDKWLPAAEVVVVGTCVSFLVVICAAVATAGVVALAFLAAVFLVMTYLVTGI